MYKQETSFQWLPMHAKIVLLLYSIYFNFYGFPSYLGSILSLSPNFLHTGRLWNRLCKKFSELHGTCKRATLHWQAQGLCLCTGANADYTEVSAKISLAQSPYNVPCEKLLTKQIYSITIYVLCWRRSFCITYKCHASAFISDHRPPSR